MTFDVKKDVSMFRKLFFLYNFYYYIFLYKENNLFHPCWNNSNDRFFVSDLGLLLTNQGKKLDHISFLSFFLYVFSLFFSFSNSVIFFHFIHLNLAKEQNVSNSLNVVAIALGVSICLDMVSIETLVLDSLKKLISTWWIISTL